MGNWLVQHYQRNNRGKDIWSRAQVVISLTNSLTQTHALFLDWFAIADGYQGRAPQPQPSRHGADGPLRLWLVGVQGNQRLDELKRQTVIAAC